MHALDLPGHGLTGASLDVANAPPSDWDFVGEHIRGVAETLREEARRDVAEQMLLSGRLGAGDSLEPLLIGVCTLVRLPLNSYTVLTSKTFASGGPLAGRDGSPTGGAAVSRRSL